MIAGEVPETAGRRGPIVVARHGRPALDLTKGPRLRWRGYIEWWAAYEAGGLRPDQCAPDELVALAADADIALTSSRLRAQQTLERALPGALETARQLDLFNEAPLPPPRIAGVRMLPKNWNVLARMVWMLGHSLGGESVSEARQRARAAALFLHEESANGKVFLTAHGWFNRMIRKELKKLGWACDHDGGDKYWAWREYTLPVKRI